jgi:hypothetical protein
VIEWHETLSPAGVIITEIPNKVHRASLDILLPLKGEDSPHGRPIPEPDGEDIPGGDGVS